MKHIIIKLNKSIVYTTSFIPLLIELTNNDTAAYAFVDGYQHFDRYKQLMIDDLHVDVDDALDKLNACKDIEIAYIPASNDIISDDNIDTSDTPNDELYDSAWHLHGGYGLHIDKVWNRSDVNYGEGIIIATIEPISHACNFMHKDFGSVGKRDEVRQSIIDGTHPSLIASTFNGEPDVPTESYGHATQTASVLVAQLNNEIGSSGIIPKAKVMVHYYGHTGVWDSAANAIVRAADSNGINCNHRYTHVNVISVSLTGNRNEPAVVDAIQYALDKSIPVVWAAGKNEDGYIQWDTAPNSIAVTSHGVDGDHRYTQGGVSVSAPGIGIWRSSPYLSEHISSDNSYEAGSGNSLATPLAAGVLALMIEKEIYNPNFNIYDIINKFFSSCDHTWDMRYGYGYVNATKALEDRNISLISSVPFNLKSNTLSYKKTFTWSDPFRTSNYNRTIIVAISKAAIPTPCTSPQQGFTIYNGTGKSLSNGEYSTEEPVWLTNGDYYFSIFNINTNGVYSDVKGIEYCDTSDVRGYLGCYDKQVMNYVKPVANFIIESDTTGVAPLTVIFNDKPEGRFDSSYCKWDFGDGEIVKGRNIEHTYDKPGKYTVTYICGNPLEIDSIIKKDIIVVTDDNSNEDEIVKLKDEIISLNKRIHALTVMNGNLNDKINMMMDILSSHEISLDIMD